MTCHKLMTCHLFYQLINDSQLTGWLSCINYLLTNEKIMTRLEIKLEDTLRGVNRQVSDDIDMLKTCLVALQKGKVNIVADHIERVIMHQESMKESVIKSL